MGCATACLHLALLVVTVRAEGEIRLVDGKNSWEGRVEIFLNGTLGTVCDDYWNDNDAEVVCRQITLYTKHARAFKWAHFGEGSGSILLDDVQCRGNESCLTDCPSNPVGIHDCGYGEDASVSCAPPAEGEIRLANGTTYWEGRVEIYVNGTWGTVCYGLWDNRDAAVVCRQLGLYTNTSTSDVGQGSGSIFLDEVQCNGDESRLSDCPANAVGNHNCQHSQDAGVSCTPPAEGEIRLVDGRHSWEGRVEIYLTETWGTVCDDLWDDNDAEVVCRQLGLSTSSALAFSDADFGKGSSRIHLDNVQCKGDESLLTDCPSNAVGTHNCRHYEDAGVSCEAVDIDALDVGLVAAASVWGLLLLVVFAAVVFGMTRRSRLRSAMCCTRTSSYTGSQWYTRDDELAKDGHVTTQEPTAEQGLETHSLFQVDGIDEIAEDESSSDSGADDNECLHAVQRNSNPSSLTPIPVSWPRQPPLSILTGIRPTRWAPDRRDYTFM